GVGGGRRFLSPGAPGALGVGAVRRRHADALADDEPEVHLDVRLGDVLVDLAVRETGQAAFVCHRHDLDLGRRLRSGEAKNALGEGEDVGRRPAVQPVATHAHHLPTPIWTFRNRAPEQAWPTLAPWPGSPLPQFLFPNIPFVISSPTPLRRRRTLSR